MALLRALLRSARRTRSASRHGDAPPADDEVLLDAPDERLAPALVAAGRGEYEPAAKLLATTREAAEWEDRDRYARRLAAFARSRPEWAEEWHASAPDDPDALLLRTQLAVDRCWASPARAELLAEMGPLVTAATEADPRDPVPWRIALDHARGTRAGHLGFERLWTEAVRRSPHHYGCHVAALHYLAATWHGSHGECLDFAESAALDAPPGALVQALPAQAALACLGPGAAAPRERLDAAADRAIALSARYPAADPWPAEMRNLLAYVLVCLDRRADALDQFGLIGPYATSFPWDRVSDDPLGLFLRLRAELPVAVDRPTRDGLIPSPRPSPNGSPTTTE
ncbi:hypothetical protein ACIREM_03620 [Streptomyces shenzhenensis]|uniref:hypothetical protein n=1 Tax=Streptomyces shenzhenensis TaxID=943815 RepID=UPI003810EC7E